VRKTGISVVGDVPWGAHFCSFYETKQDLLDILILISRPDWKQGVLSLGDSNSELLTVEEAGALCEVLFPTLTGMWPREALKLSGMMTGSQRKNV